MPDANLVSGDLVVVLAGLLRSSAVFAGAISLAVSIWSLKRSIPLTIAAIFLGGVGGFLLGSVIGPLFFPAQGDTVVVVKVGPGALALALKAGLIGGVILGALMGIVPALIISGMAKLARLAGINVAIGVIVGILSAYISTRP